MSKWSWHRPQRSDLHPELGLQLRDDILRRVFLVREQREDVAVGEEPAEITVRGAAEIGCEETYRKRL